MAANESARFCLLNNSLQPTQWPLAGRFVPPHAINVRGDGIRKWNSPVSPTPIRFGPMGHNGTVTTLKMVFYPRKLSGSMPLRGLSTNYRHLSRRMQHSSLVNMSEVPITKPARCRWHQFTFHAGFHLLACITWRETSGSGAEIGLLTTSINDVNQVGSIRSTNQERAFAANVVVVGSGQSNCAAPHIDVDESQTPVAAA